MEAFQHLDDTTLCDGISILKNRLNKKMFVEVVYFFTADRPSAKRAVCTVAHTSRSLMLVKPTRVGLKILLFTPGPEHIFTVLLNIRPRTPTAQYLLVLFG